MLKEEEYWEAVYRKTTLTVYEGAVTTPLLYSIEDELTSV
jgi:hypothetical protein